MKNYLLSHTYLNDDFKNSNTKTMKIIGNYDFFYISKKLEYDPNSIIYQNFKNSKIILINHYSEQEDFYFIFGFKRTIIIIDESNLIFLETLFQFNSDLNFIFLSNSKNIFNEKIQIKYNEIEVDLNFIEEVKPIYNSIIFNQNKNFHKNFLNKIAQCISGYLIKQSYYKLKQNRIKTFNHVNNLNKIIKKEDFIEIRRIGTGSLFVVKLIYHTENEEFFAIKIPCKYDAEVPKLVKREIQNYSKLNHPLFPKFFGKIENGDLYVIEFINGQPLINIEKLHLNEKEKITIIFELMLIIEYLHRNHFIFRDLKPNNIMIDENNVAVLIDFDRMISEEEYEKEKEVTKEFPIIYSAPESNYGIFSDKSDIFSLGQVIYFIMNEEDPRNDDIKSSEKISEVYHKCTKLNANERPTIIELIRYFYITFHNQIEFDKFYFNDENFSNDLFLTMKRIENEIVSPSEIFLIGHHYFIGENNDIEKAIHYFQIASDRNNSDAQFYLGCIYGDGKYVPIDINKSIHYHSLAADQGHLKSQFRVAFLYDEGKDVTRNISKAIHYYTLASNQNNPRAQNNLGLIYYEGKYIQQDIEKAIFYFELAARQNINESQYFLGKIFYFNKKNIEQALKYLKLSADNNNPDALFLLGLIYTRKNCISNAIQYFQLASNFNHSEAQLNLGFIYYNKQLLDYFDINKSLHYFSLSANNCNPKAQFCLAEIFFEGKLVSKDVNKAIHYYSLAAKQNNGFAYFRLGCIFYDGINVECDLYKALNYFKLASNLNYHEAHFYLGYFYFHGIIVDRNYDEAIKYLKLASDQNNKFAQYLLGCYYSDILTTPNNNQAIFYYSCAAKQNYAPAQYKLGLILLDSQFIDKAIYYLTIAADNNNYSYAQFLLGKFFIEGKYDIQKGIHYLQLASAQNCAEAQFLLGIVYSKGKFNCKDKYKAINYFKLAANQGYLDALYNLGIIYYINIDIPRDIELSKHYLLKAAEENHSLSQYALGLIYYDENIHKDLKKAIHYFELSAHQKNPLALYMLGFIYSEEKGFPHDINKAIEYYTLSSNLNYANAQLELGLIYSNEKSTFYDLEKSIHYYKLAALNKNSNAQNVLGTFYLKGLNVKQNVNIGIYWLTESAENSNKNACYQLGFLYHEGKILNQDINKAIHYYNEASNDKNQYAKNNLGVIYKNAKNIAKAIELLTEAFKQKNDFLAMYNLANIYIFSCSNDHDDDYLIEIIELLAKSSNQGFLPSFELLCLFLIKKFGFNHQNFISDINKLDIITDESLTNIYNIIEDQKLYDEYVFELLLDLHRNYYFIYDFNNQPIELNNIFGTKRDCQKENIKNITAEFYKGFGYDLYSPTF